MLDARELKRAVDLQRRSYKLLLWLDSALTRKRLFCDYCRTLISLGRLKTRKLRRQDRLEARDIKVSYLDALANELGLSLSRAGAERVAAGAESAEDVALATYGRELIRRMHGLSKSPALLVLLRDFAWERHRHPKKGFELEAESVLEAEEKLKRILAAL